jgi:hypothetical protein
VPPRHRQRLLPRVPAARSGFAQVGTKKAVYREWVIPCNDLRTGAVKASFVQRVWYLPQSQVLIVDEWSVPGLPEVLAGASWRR